MREQSTTRVDRVCTFCGRTFQVMGSNAKTQHRCSMECRRLSMLPSVQVFLSVDRSGGLFACWPWLGQRDDDGYGLLWVGKKRLRAHRTAWEIANEREVPDDLMIRHLCAGGGNPWCCNPFHLAPGTVQDNADDRVRSGRQLRGETNGKSVFTEVQVIEIRRRRAEGESRQVLANEFGVTRSAIGHIVSRRVWRHLP